MQTKEHDKLQSELKILHLFQDSVFVRNANYLYEKAFPRHNTFIIIKKEKARLNYIKRDKNFLFITLNKTGFKKILQIIPKYDLVVLHSFSKVNANIFLKSEVKNKFILHAFGFEIYNEKVLGDSFLGPMTRKLVNMATLESQLESRKNKESKGSINGSITNKIFSVIRKISHTFSNRNKLRLSPVNIKTLFHEITYHGTFLSEEFVFFKSKGIINDYAKVFPFTYYPIDYIFDNNNLTLTGNNILLGNSASNLNNHLEAIDLLSNLKIGDREILIPLSYGKEDYYIAEITKFANEKIPLKFKIIKDFLPLNHYIKLISQCSIVIMNHYRQQAVGNILISLFIGAKVYMNDTVIYQYLKRIGCCIYLIEDLSKMGDLAFEPLSLELVESNRYILQKELSTETVVNNLRKGILDVIEDVNISYQA